MVLLVKHTRKSFIRVDYRSDCPPVLVCGSEAWTFTKVLAQRLDADTWSLRKIQTCYQVPTLLSGILPGVLQFPFLLKTRWLHLCGHVAHWNQMQEDHHQSISATQQATGEDLEDTQVPPGWLMPKYSRVTLVSTQPTIVCSGDVLLKRQHSIRSMPLTKDCLITGTWKCVLF